MDKNKYNEQKMMEYALNAAEIISLSFRKKYQNYDVSEMLSIANVVIAECWNKRDKILDWDNYIWIAITNRLKNYNRGQERKRKFIAKVYKRNQMDRRLRVGDKEYSEVLDRTIYPDEKEFEAKCKLYLEKNKI